MQSLREISESTITQFISHYAQARVDSTMVITRLVKMPNDGKCPADVIGTPPSPGGAMALTGMNAVATDGVMRIDWTFHSGGGGYSNGNAEDRTIELNGSVAADPITSHPKIGYLLANYANDMRDGKVLWKPTIAGSTTVGFDKNTGQVVSNINPLSNVDSYYAPGATYQYTKSYEAGAAPVARNLSLVGTIVTSTSDGTTLPVWQGDYRNWLHGGFTMEQSGNRYVVSEKYLLSGLGGWNRYIYK